MTRKYHIAWTIAVQPIISYKLSHGYLGFIYLAMGDVTNAEAEYFKADELFPSEENDKNLAAVRKRLATGAGFNLLSK